MKKAAVLIISFAMLFSSFFVVLDMNVEGKEVLPAPFFAGGDGSVGDPYQIADITDLQDMNLELNAHYVLVNDIDASATSTWDVPPGGDIEGFDPVGESGTPFTGSLDGQNFIIIDLFIGRSTEVNVGLFGYLDASASIDNLGLENGNISGLNYVGAISGQNYGTIMNCYSTGDITGAGYEAGGFVGRNDGGTITNCYSTGNLTSTVDESTGGFAGYNDNNGNIKNCYSTVTVVSNDYVGGFIGYNEANITDCYSTGNVSGITDVGGFAGANTGGGIITNCYSTGTTTGTYHVGGFAGVNSGGGIITNCYSIGDATNATSTSHSVGGFIGDNFASIKNCYSTGTASGGTEKIGGFVGVGAGAIINCYSTGNASGSTNSIGGFVGFNYNDGTLTNCYSTGDASGTSSVGGFAGDNDDGTITNCYGTGDASGTASQVGGFAGRNGDIIINCYSIGNASATSSFGGFAGNNAGTILSCFWDTQASLTVPGIGSGTLDGATGKITAEMMQSATFNPPWDFTSIWGIIEDTTYPFLTPISPVITTGDICSINLVNNFINEDAAYSFDFDSAAQVLPDTNVITWSVSANVETWLSVSSDGLASGTPTNADVGTHSVSIIATDSLGSTGYFDYTLTVRNTAPVITTTNISSVTSGTLYSNDYDSSDDPSTTWSVSGNATGWLSIDNSGVLSGTPTNAQAGIYNVEVVVNDGNGGTDNQIFTLTVNLDTDGDGTPDITDSDDDNDGTPDASDDFPLDPAEDTDTDLDGIGNNADTDDDDDGWLDTVEIVGGFDPLDNTSMPSDADSDGIANFMDPDFLSTPVNVTVPVNVTIGVTDTDSDGDGWNDSVELLAGSDPLDATDEPADADGDGIADFMDMDNVGDPGTATVTETPTWAYIAAVVAGLMTVLAVIGFGRKPESKHPDEREEFEKEDDMDLEEKEDDEEGTVSHAETQTPYDRLG